MKNFIDSALIGSLATYLPFWIIDSTVQRIVLAIGLRSLTETMMREKRR